MRPAKSIVIVVFFTVVSGVVFAGVVRTLRGDPTARRLTDSVFAFVNADLQDLERKKIQRDAAVVALEIARIDDQRQALPLWRKLKLTGAGVVCVALAGGVVCVSLSYGRRLSVYVLELRGARIPIRHNDLRQALPVAYDLALAEKMEQQAPEKAFLLYERLANLRLKELATLGKTALTALPEHVTAPAVMTAHSAPTFADLLQDGAIGAGRPLVFGFADDRPVVGSWQDLFSCAVGGRAGSGKTSTLRSLISQSVLQGCRFHLIDPHYPHKESLQASLRPLIDAGRVVVDLPLLTLKTVKQTIARRLKGLEPSDAPVILCIDELLTVLAKVPDTADTLLKIGTEGRKVNVFGLFAGHSWQAGRTGGDTAVRDNLTALFCHAMKRKQAQLLTQDAEMARHVATLRTGQALFAPVNADPCVVTVPHCPPRDVERVAGRWAETAPQTVSKLVETPGETAPAIVPAPLTETGRVSDRFQGGEMLQTVRALCQQQSLSKVAEQAGVNKGNLLQVLRGAKPLSDGMKAKLTAYLRGKTPPETAPAQVIPFPQAVGAA